MRLIRALYFGIGVFAALLALRYASMLLALQRGDAAGGVYSISGEFALAVGLLGGASFAAGSRDSTSFDGRLRSLVAGALFCTVFAWLVVGIEAWSGTPLRLIGWETLFVFAVGSFFVARRATRVTAPG